MYFEKKVMIKNNNGYWEDKTDYKPIVENQLKGNQAILVKGNNWKIVNNHKIEFNGGLI